MTEWANYDVDGKRAQSASCIVHCIVPVVCAPILHQRLEPAFTPEDSLLTWDDDLRGSMRRLVASPMGTHHSPMATKD
jgi:hypothetical protein